MENDLERMAREMEVLKAQLNRGHSLAANRSSSDYTGQTEKGWFDQHHMNHVRIPGWGPGGSDFPSISQGMGFEMVEFCWTSPGPKLGTARDHLFTHEAITEGLI